MTIYLARTLAARIHYGIATHAALKYITIGRSLKYLRMNHAVLRLCRQNLVPLLAMEPCGLTWSNAAWCPAYASDISQGVAARFVYEDELGRLVLRQLM